MKSALVATMLQSRMRLDELGGCASYDFWESRVERANMFLSNLSKFFDDGQNCRSPFGVRIITLCQLILCYYLLSRYETR